MGEVVPIFGGVIAGFAVGHFVQGWRARFAPLIAAAAVVGVFAAWVSDELAESPAFLAIDVPGSFLAAAVTALTVDRLGTRVSRQRPPQR